MNEETKCSVCGTSQSKYGWMGQGKYMFCNDCSKDLLSFKNQIQVEHNIPILMELYFRKGRGEKLSYEELHKERSDIRFLELRDLLFPDYAKESSNGSEVKK